MSGAIRYQQQENKMKKIPATKIVKGLKFLTHGCSTIHEGVEYSYVPAINEWMKHPAPAKWDMQDCGTGRWHVMSKLSSCYAPANWVAWRAYGRGVTGYSNEKFGCIEIMIRPIPRRVWYRYIRRFGSYADLSYANLRYANLSGANLSCADLSCADLRWVNLDDANLSCANLSGANLSYANLRRADLYYADLRDAYANKYTIFPADFDIAASGVKML